MPSTLFSSIELGKRSLFAHQIGIQTIGHNISNIDTDGYSRQRVDLDSASPLDAVGNGRAQLAGQIGQGTVAARVARVKDQLLEGRVLAETSKFSYWDSADAYLLQVERIYNEPSEYSLRNAFDNFWNAWQDLSLRPTESAVRRGVLETGHTLADSIRDQYQQLEQIRSVLEEEVIIRVGQINDLTAEIADLNREIAKIKGVGDEANDLLDTRDRKIEQLATHIAITTSDRDNDDFTVYSDGRHLVQGGNAHRLSTFAEPAVESFSIPVWEEGGERFQFASGTLAAMLELRDEVIEERIVELDTLSINFSDLVNEIHRRGVGLNGETGVNFFVESPRVINVAGNFDSDNDGIFDSSYIFKINGTNRLNAQQQVGFGGTLSLPAAQGTIAVDYNPTDTVGQIIERINRSGADVVARLTDDNRLQVKATSDATGEFPDFVIRSLEDSGQFLVGYSGILQQSGALGGYGWQQADAVNAFQSGDYGVAPLMRPSGWLAISPEIESNTNSIAAALRDEVRSDVDTGGNGAAVAIASLRNTNIFIDRRQNIDEFFTNQIGSIGYASQRAEYSKHTHEDILKGLTDIRQSISGVNIDEEVAQLLKYQHAYAATARFVSNINTMLDTIINRMGV